MIRDLGAFATSVFTHWFSAMCGVLSVGLTCASPFVSSSAYQHIFMATAAICFLSASFAAWRREHKERASLALRVALQGCLQIDFMPGKHGFEEERRGTYGVRRTLSVRLSNVGGASIRGVRVYAMSINPNDGNLADPIPLHGPAEDLNPGDFRFRPIATYNEAGENTGGDTIGTLHVPFSSRYLDGGGERTIGRDVAYELTLRATGDGAPMPCDRVFRVWISEGRLRMVGVESANFRASADQRPKFALPAT